MQTRIALVTCQNEEKTRSIARQLVESGCAACVNIVPGVKSIYRWQGRVEEDAEFLMIIKTSAEMLARLEAEIARLHPYDTPEFAVLSPEFVSPKYEAWLIAAVK